MSARTIELIIKVATEVFQWVMTILRDKRNSKGGERHDGTGASEKK